MAAHYEADERLDELEDEIYDCFDNVYGRTEGTHAEKLEAAVLVVCQRFHLVYYRGEGRELARVSPRPRGRDPAVRPIQARRRLPAAGACRQRPKAPRWRGGAPRAR